VLELYMASGFLLGMLDQSVQMHHFRLESLVQKEDRG
jgi:hypothetical protein